MYFEYISLCLFWNGLIYLMPIYCCFYVSWFCFTNWKQIEEMKTCRCSNVKQTMHQQFFITHVLLFIYVLLFWLWVTILQKKKWSSFHCIYWYVTYYVLLCRIWSDVSWSKLVKWFYSEFPNHDKRQKRSQSHNLPFCSHEKRCHTLHQEQEI